MWQTFTRWSRNSTLQGHQLFSCSVVNCSFYFSHGKSIAIFAWRKVRYVLEYQSIKRLQNCNGPMAFGSDSFIEAATILSFVYSHKGTNKKGYIGESSWGNGFYGFSSVKVNFRDGWQNILCSQLFFLRITVKICQFVRLTADVFCSFMANG